LVASDELGGSLAEDSVGSLVVVWVGVSVVDSLGVLGASVVSEAAFEMASAEPQALSSTATAASVMT
jgi:hypothetical protein